ncbi:MAG: MetS family NSS transporter small subunit [Actinomycetota bacterium]|jgi:hypothetical protein|nr:MetS family NSS transporter small subunit [Rubrobacter sp.]MDQ3507237.1 MetS family NSS transporter small subunit [Actinomycetota bacterium]
MNTGAIVMLAIGAAGLWGGLVFFLRNYFKAEKAEREAAEREAAERGEASDREANRENQS